MGGRIVPMIGKIFNELTVIEFAYVEDAKGKVYKCLCSCGNFRIARGERLRNGEIKRCDDCQKSFRFDNASEEYKKAKLRHGRTKFVWKALVQRCTNPNNKDYDNYLGRGITIDDPRWFIYANFKLDMGEAPDGFQIDRIDNDKGYCKANCRWTTPTVNANNRRPEFTAKKVRDESMNGAIV